MADTKITDLAALTGAGTAAGDLFVVVDVSDATMAASGTDKKITRTEMLNVFDAAGAAATAQAAAIAASQPLDSDLTAIAALATTAYGRALLVLADQAALTAANAAATATLSGIVELATSAETITGTDTVRAVTPAGAAAAYQPLDSDLTSIAALSTTSYGRALLALANAAAADWVTKALYDANTILYATTDDTPVALAVGASTVVGRKASGSIVALTGAETAAIQAGETFKQAQEFNAQTGTTYTLVAGDAGKVVSLSNASAITLTLPQDSDATIAVGTWVDLYQLGAGQVTVAAGTGATLRTSGLTAKARAQYSRFGVQKVSANTWSLFGDLAAS